MKSQKEHLTAKEEELMRLLWANGPMTVRQMLELLPEPRPHFNTVSTFIRLLEQKGFVDHESIGHNYRYFAAVTEADYSCSALRQVVSRYFNNSLHNAISALVQREELTEAEIAELVQMVREGGAAKE